MPSDAPKKKCKCSSKGFDTPKTHTNIQDTSHSGVIPTEELDDNSLAKCNGTDKNVPENETTCNTHVDGIVTPQSGTAQSCNVDDTQHVTGCTYEVTPTSESGNLTAPTHNVTAESADINKTQDMIPCETTVTPESENVTGHTNHVTAESGNGNETQQMSQSQPIVTPERNYLLSQLIGFRLKSM